MKPTRLIESGAGESLRQSAKMLEIKINSLPELLSLARQIEHDAVIYYRAIAQQMRRDGDDAVAAVFDDIATAEEAHGDAVDRLIDACGINDLPAAGQPLLPVEAESELRDRALNPVSTTPYLALAYAVSNEEWAFGLYTRIAASTTDPEVRQFAESLASEELEHAALFRAQRRKAFRHQEPSSRASVLPSPASVRLVGGLAQIALRIEKQFAATFEGQAPSVETVDCVRRTEAMISRLADITRGQGADDAVEFDFDHMAAINPAVLGEQALVFYTEIAEQAVAEDVLVLAQELAMHTFRQLACLDARPEAKTGSI